MQNNKNKWSLRASRLPAACLALVVSLASGPNLSAEEGETVLPESGYLDDAVMERSVDENQEQDAEEATVIGPIDPIQVHSEHILRAQLTPALEDKGPTERLGSTIQMNERGLIRVYLFTELEGLSNRRVYYDWYHEDERQARVTVRPSLEQMRASSSKFIDRHTTGRWQVIVRLSDDTVLASASFDVVPYNGD